MQTQNTSRRVEIVVVDNNPESEFTPPVVAEFPEGRSGKENRKGLSYARNKGIVCSTGDIIVAIDDDVVVPPNWLENLVAPFVRDEVAIVTGNVLPFQLETRAQQPFDAYGGLGKGFDKFEVNYNWLYK